MQLNDLKNYNTETGNIESLVEMLAYGRLIRAEYEALEDNGVEMPEWLDGKLKKLRRKIVAVQDDINRKKMADVALRIESNKTPAQKKAEDVKELRRLKALVGEDAE